MRFFKRLFKPKVITHREIIMNHYSQEYLDKLIAEHKLISTAYANLHSSAQRFASQHGHDAVSSALSSMRVKRIELESQIEVLSDYLN